MRGRIYTQTPANPAAGADLVVAMAAGKLTFVHSLKFHLQTSAVVANRDPRVELRDAAGNVYSRIAGGIGLHLVATSSADLFFGASDFQGVQINGNTVVLLPATTQWVTPGGSIRTQIVGLDAGDQLSAIVLLVEEWDA